MSAFRESACGFAVAEKAPFHRSQALVEGGQGSLEPLGNSPGDRLWSEPYLSSDLICVLGAERVLTNQGRPRATPLTPKEGMLTSPHQRSVLNELFTEMHFENVHE